MISSHECLSYISTTLKLYLCWGRGRGKRERGDSFHLHGISILGAAGIDCAHVFSNISLLVKIFSLFGIVKNVLII